MTQYYPGTTESIPGKPVKDFWWEDEYPFGQPSERLQLQLAAADNHIREVEHSCQQAMIIALDSRPASQQLLFTYLYVCEVKHDGYTSRYCRNRHGDYLVFVRDNRFLLEPVYEHLPRPVISNWKSDFSSLVNGIYSSVQTQLGFDRDADSVLASLKALIPPPETYF